MEHPGLKGLYILVVEDEILIAMDIAQALKKAGAIATMTTTIRHAMILAEHHGLSGAIMDHGMSKGDSLTICKRLNERGIPYICFSGFNKPEGHIAGTTFVDKLASMDTLMTAMENLIGEKPPRVF